MLPRELDGDALVVCSGMKTAAFGTPGIVDRPAAEDLGKPLQRRIVARIDEPVTAGGPGDVAAVEGGNRKTGERLHHHIAQPRLADILVQHPEKMADLGVAAVTQSFLREARIHVLGELAVADEGGMRVEQIERAGIADRHQRQALVLRERKNAHVQGIKAGGVDRAQFAGAGAGCRFERESTSAPAVRLPDASRH